jgi:hypothetical protein
VTRAGRRLPGARVNFAGGSARAGRRGRATVSTRLELPGRYKALARQGSSYGLSRLLPVGIAP